MELLQDLAPLLGTILTVVTGALTAATGRNRPLKRLEVVQAEVGLYKSLPEGSAPKAEMFDRLGRSTAAYDAWQRQNGARRLMIAGLYSSALAFLSSLAYSFVDAKVDGKAPGWTGDKWDAVLTYLTGFQFALFYLAGYFIFRSARAERKFWRDSIVVPLTMPVPDTRDVSERPQHPPVSVVTYLIRIPVTILVALCASYPVAHYLYGEWFRGGSPPTLSSIATALVLYVALVIGLAIPVLALVSRVTVHWDRLNRHPVLEQSNGDASQP